jgi:hypothetical protein
MGTAARASGLAEMRTLGPLSPVPVQRSDDAAREPAMTGYRNGFSK